VHSRSSPLHSPVTGDGRGVAADLSGPAVLLTLLAPQPAAGMAAMAWLLMSVCYVPALRFYRRAMVRRAAAPPGRAVLCGRDGTFRHRLLERRGRTVERPRARRLSGPTQGNRMLQLVLQQFAQLVGQELSPMSLTLPERWDSALIVGRTPWSARDALVALLPRRIRHLRSLRSRPGGRLRTRASAPQSDADGRTWQSKWH
jgi:hypothetical protein